jgi:hypothetical protein
LLGIADLRLQISDLKSATKIAGSLVKGPAASSQQAALKLFPSQQSDTGSESAMSEGAKFEKVGGINVVVDSGGVVASIDIDKSTAHGPIAAAPVKALL